MLIKHVVPLAMVIAQLMENCAKPAMAAAIKRPNQYPVLFVKKTEEIYELTT